MCPRKNFLRSNVLTIAINELLSRNLITLDYNDHDDDNDTVMHRIDINIDGIMLLVNYHHIGFGEISITVWGVVPQDNSAEWDRPPECHFFMHGYLERKSGKYIMDSQCCYSEYRIKTRSVKGINGAKNHYLNEFIKKYRVENVIPNGYAKKGKFIF